MDKFSQNFSKEDIMNLAKSPAGQQLIAILQQGDSAKLQQVTQQAQSGDYDSAKQTLQSMLSSPEARKLLKELGNL